MPFSVSYIAMAAVVGLVMGSFVNCWAWRYVRGESVARGRSRCPSCGHGLAARDLVPVASWVALRGRCRYCGARIPARYPAAELACAAVFAALAWAYGPTVEALELAAFSCLLLFCSLVDIEARVIPNGCVLAACAVRAAYLAHACATGAMSAGEAGFYVASGAGMGAALLAATLIADRVFGRESMGGGDLKLYAAACLYFGWLEGLFLLIVACAIGIATAALAPSGAPAADGGADGAGQGFLKRAIPFGPSLAAACVVTMLAGDPVISWYLGLL